MGIRKQIHVKSKQKLRRKKRRDQLKKKGANLSDYFVGAHYVGPHKAKAA